MKSRTHIFEFLKYLRVDNNLDSVDYLNVQRILTWNSGDYLDSVDYLNVQRILTWNSGA